MFLMCAARIVIVIWRSEVLRSLNIKNVIVSSYVVMDPVYQTVRYHIPKGTILIKIWIWPFSLNE